MSTEAATPTSPDGIVSVERDGRVLSGAGASVEQLETVMDRHTPPATEPPDGTVPLATEGAPAPSEAPAPSAGKPTRGAQRFSDLTKARDEAKQRADAAEAARVAAERERDELRQQVQARQTPAAAPTPVTVPPTRPEPSPDEIGTKYETYEAFSRDLARWDREQERAQEKAEREQAEQQRQQSEAAQSWAAANKAYGERLVTFKAAHPDYDTLVQQHGSVPLPGPVLMAIVTSEQGPAWSYALMQQPHLLAEVAMAFDGRPATPDIIAHATRWLSSRAQPPAAPVRSAPIAAPAPMQPVGSGSKTTVTPSSELPKRGFDFDASGYREKRAAERGVKSRRFS